MFPDTSTSRICGQTSMHLLLVGMQLAQKKIKELNQGEIVIN